LLNKDVSDREIDAADAPELGNDSRARGCWMGRTAPPASPSIRKIQWVKYTARGFRSETNFITAIYFHCSGLDLMPSTR
jgi:hypothetical protein